MCAPYVIVEQWRSSGGLQQVCAPYVIVEQWRSSGGLQQVCVPYIIVEQWRTTASVCSVYYSRAVEDYSKCVLRML